MRTYALILANAQKNMQMKIFIETDKKLNKNKNKSK